MNILRTWGIAALVFSAIGLAACGNPHSGAAATAGNNVDQAARSAGNAVGTAAANTGQAITDTAITTQVKAAIMAEPGLKVMQIGVDTNQGVVTLTGTVKSQRDSDRATAVARGVNGVKSVNNQLTITPNS
jgi:hyperosmotically inducible protein